MKLLDRAVETAVGGLLVVLVVTAFAQVVARYVVGRPFTWVLELDILLMIWATLLSGYVGVRRDLHLRVSYFLERASPARRRVALVIGRALAMVFVAVVGVTSFDVIAAMDGIEFTAIPLGIDVLYWSLPTGAALMLLALGVGLVDDVRASSPEAGASRDPR